MRSETVRIHILSEVFEFIVIQKCCYRGNLTYRLLPSIAHFAYQLLSLVYGWNISTLLSWVAEAWESVSQHVNDSVSDVFHLPAENQRIKGWIKKHKRHGKKTGDALSMCLVHWKR